MGGMIPEVDVAIIHKITSPEYMLYQSSDIEQTKNGGTGQESIVDHRIGSLGILFVVTQVIES